MRLADRVFAPHYAAAITRVVSVAIALRASRDADSQTLVTLAPGDVFEVLELSAGSAWGRAPAAGLVGYVDAASLTAAA
ncbi:SH3 domain-containing protein [Sphingomonas sp. LT1P40]|uniref:SH3 domain-containing protein n=1 Tax=Alteristakelama amylovorans TaxID=3096166 RepID=UPI002FCA6C98